VERAVHEGHASNTVVDAGHNVGKVRVRLNCTREVSVDVGKRFDEPFWMAEWQPKRRATWLRQGRRIARTVKNLAWLIVPIDPQVVRIFLRPIDAAFVAVDAKPQSVSFARGNLGRVEDAGRPVAHAQ